MCYQFAYVQRARRKTSKAATITWNAQGQAAVGDNRSWRVCSATYQVRSRQMTGFTGLVDAHAADEVLVDGRIAETVH